MSAIATMKKFQGLWFEGKLQEMANCWDKNGTVKLCAKVWPEFDRIFTGPAGMLDWIALIHKRFVFHDAVWEDYTESADKSVGGCAFTNYTTDTSTGKKQQNKFLQRVRIDTETGLIKSFTISVTNPDDTLGSATLYGCVRSESKLKKGSRQAVGQKLEEILPLCYRVEGYVSSVGYFKDDETYIRIAVYETIEKAHASQSDPTFGKLFANFGEWIIGHTASVHDAFWAGGHMASQGKAFAAVSNIHLKQGGRNVLLAPNDMIEKTLQFPGFLGVVEVIHNDNLLEAVAIYSTEEHAKGAGELAKPLMAEMINHLAAIPERNIYPAYSLTGCDGFHFLHEIAFADAEIMQAWKDLVRHEEEESNLLWWPNGELSVRALGTYSSSQYAKVVARYKSNPAEVERVIAGITKASGIYTGASGAAEAILAGWASYPQISIDYAKPNHANITTTNVSAAGAFLYVSEIECVEGKRDEFDAKAKADAPLRFDLLNGTRQESAAWISVGDNVSTAFGVTNKAAFLKNQETNKTVQPTYFTPEYVKHCTCTVVSAGPVDADVKAALDKWDAMENVTINYVTADPASVLRF
jgi:hypothetical protein